jgi:hypothetical protein
MLHSEHLVLCLAVLHHSLAIVYLAHRMIQSR